MSTPIFYLHIQSQGCTAELRLNDAPMFVVSREHPQRARPSVSEWVIAGENLLELRVHELADSPADEAPRIRVALCQALLGDVPEPGRELELAVIEWPPLPLPGLPVDAAVDTPVQLPTEPFALQRVAIAQHRWGRWAWQDTPPFSPDAHTTAAVAAYVRDLHATLAAGSVDALIAHSQLKFKEVAPLYDMTAADAETRVRNAWAGLTSDSRWEFAAFDEADLDFRLHCDGRLVEPTTLAGEPIIRQARPIDDEQWSLPIFIARTNWGVVDGQLTILR